MQLWTLYSYGHKCVTKASVSLYSRRIHIWYWVLVWPGLSRSGATRVVTTGWLCLECLGCRYRRKHVSEPLRRGEAKAGAAADESQSKCSAKTKVSRPSDVSWAVLGSGGLYGGCVATSRFLVLIKFHLKPLEISTGSTFILYFSGIQPILSSTSIAKISTRPSVRPSIWVAFFAFLCLSRQITPP